MGEIVRARIPTLQKMAQLLQVFTPMRPRWRLEELARELGWDGASTHRFLKALTALRMLEMHQDGSYSLGTLTVELAAVYMSTDPRRQDLLDRLEKLSDATGLTMQIGILDHDRLAIVGSQEGRSALKAAALLGERLPLHATAGGKAILSEIADTEIAKLLPQELEGFTANTLTTRTELLEAIAEVRVSGIARACSELTHGLYAVAVPLPAGFFDSAPSTLTCAGPAAANGSRQWEQAEEVLHAELERIRAIADPVRLGDDADQPSGGVAPQPNAEEEEEEEVLIS